MRLWLWNRRDRAADSPQLQTKLLGRHALSIYLQHGIQVWRVCALPGASGQCTAVPSISCWETPDKSAAPRRPLDCCRRSEAKGGGVQGKPKRSPNPGHRQGPHLLHRSRPRGGPQCCCSRSSYHGTCSAASWPWCRQRAAPRYSAGRASLSRGPEGCAACGRPPTHSCPEKVQQGPDVTSTREHLSIRGSLGTTILGTGNTSDQEPLRGLYPIVGDKRSPNQQPGDCMCHEGNRAGTWNSMGEKGQLRAS